MQLFSGGQNITQHERIREHVRPADEIGDDDLGISALKGERVRH